MRTLSVLICALVLALPVHGATSVTVAQLQQFLSSTRAARLSDAEIAQRLSKVDLSEELTSKSLARILAESSPGPETEQQLALLAAASAVHSPPMSELPNEPPPDQATQSKIVKSARDHAGIALHTAPDFLALRDTQAYDNLPIDAPKKHQRPRVEMHFVRESRREIAVRNGKEVHGEISGREGAANSELSSGLSTWGEFGAILNVVLGDKSDETLQWKRWQKSESGVTLAVFQYSIPRSSSHYTVDFCCYRRSDDDPIDRRFKDKPGYHGTIYIDPKDGEIDRITLEADLAETDPVTVSSIAVQYGRVFISGKPYLCPIWSVALTELQNNFIEKIDGIGIERHLNKTDFSHYHKFGSTARIMTGIAGPPQP